MKKFAIALSTLALPALALAQYTVNNSGDLYTTTLNVINRVVTIIIALAVVYTIYGAFKYAFGDEENKANYKNNILYGLIALFVMVSIWGLVNILTGTFQLQSNTVPTTLPDVSSFERSAI
ncbi:MAG: pilin [Patescibacteria group bacterium]